MVASAVRYSMRVSGRVQGVGFRFFTQRCANAHSLTGWARNCVDGDVETEVQGPQTKVAAFRLELQKGPSLGFVSDLKINEIPPVPGEKRFEIRY